MGLMHATMLTELSRPSPAIFPALKVQFPATVSGGGTANHRQVSSVSLASTATGAWLPRVRRWDKLRRRVILRTCGLEMTEFSVDVVDYDRWFTRLLIGVDGQLVRNAPFTLHLASPNVAQANWFLLFSGVLYDYEQMDPLVWTWRFKPNAVPLERPCPREAISLAEWPNSSPEARTLYPNHPYGTISTLGGGGAIEAPLVDVGRWRYLVARGCIKAVDAVYLDKVPTTNFTTSYVTVGGKKWTVIDLSSVPSSHTPEVKVTVDVQGYTANADGSGSVITLPTDQVKHALVNWVYNDYMAAASWFADATAPVDTTLFTAAAAFSTARSHKGAFLLGGKAARTGVSVLEVGADSFQFYPFWTNSGLLGVRFENPMATPYPSARIAQERDVLAVSGIKYSTRDLIDRVYVNFLYIPASDGFTQHLEVRDPSLNHNAQDSLDMLWSHGSAT